MFCCSQHPLEGTGRSSRRPRVAVDRHTQFILDKHAMELTRIGRLSSPAFARRTRPFLIEGPGGGATRHEKHFLLDGLLSELEHSGWLLKSAVQALWAGERDVATLQAAARKEGASDLLMPQLTFVLEYILRAVPQLGGVVAAGSPRPMLDCVEASPQGLQRTVGSRRMAISSPSPMLRGRSPQTVEPMDLGQGVAKRSDALGPKQPHEIAAIGAAIDRNAMLAGLDRDTRDRLTACMSEHAFAEGNEIVTQGQVGGSAGLFYLVKSGRCVSYVDGKIVRALGPGSSFGEVALMYGGDAADATVRAVVPSSLWSVSRSDFERVVLGPAMARRAMYDTVLAGMALLRPLDRAERGAIADALVSRELGAGEVCVDEGEVTTVIYFVQSGELVTTSNAETVTAPDAGAGDGLTLLLDTPAADEKSCTYRLGDYFGAVSLLTDAPQPHAVVAGEGGAVVLMLERRVFKRLVGAKNKSSNELRQILVHSGQVEGGVTPHGTRNAALVAASEDVWINSEEEEEISPPYPVLLEKIETVALDPTCQGNVYACSCFCASVYIASLCVTTNQQCDDMPRQKWQILLKLGIADRLH